MNYEHRFPLSADGWSVWRQAFFRTTGFPADGLDLLAAPECARTADAFRDGEASAADFEHAFTEALASGSRHAYEIAADPRFREAITWQNPGAITFLDALRRSGPEGSRNTRRRYREQQLSRFWQRYCAKTETIGFFGPGLWVTVGEHSPQLTAVPGDGLLDCRRVFLEPWALAAYGARLTEDPELRRWLPPAPVPHYLASRGCLHRPGLPAVPLSGAEAAVLAASDGDRTATEVVAALRADPALAVGDDEAGFQLLAEMAGRKLLTWDANLPVDPSTHAVLTRRIGAIGDERLQRRARTGLARLTSAAGQVAAAAGDPDALAAALATLDDEFTSVTGQEPRRRQGQTYAGRGVCYEDTTRNLRVVIGRSLVDGIGAALAVMLQAARWVTSEVSRAYETALAGHVAALPAGRQPTLADLWYPAMEMFHGQDAKPVDEVLQTLASRWEKLFDLAAAPPGTKRLDYSSAELADRLRDLFPAERPGWSLARIHSPDIHVCARSADAINDGDFLAVLGELHIGYATLAGTCATWSQADPGRVLELAVSDFGQPRLLPLFPAAWTRDPGRNVQIEHCETDHYIGFARARGVDARRLIPVGSVPVSFDGGELTGPAPDGRRLPLREFFAFFLSRIVVNAFRDVASHRHTPRITIDQLVVFRETWRMTIADLDRLAGTVLRDEAGQYLAGRSLAAELGLPDRCFVKVASETKPCYVDFTSPLYVASFCTMLRSARESAGPGTKITISEMLPTPDQTWVPDRDGRRYFGEIRLHVTDPAAAPLTAARHDRQEQDHAR